MNKAKQVTTIDQYIGAFSPDVQKVLQKIRQTVHRAAPKAEETISYQIPTFKQNGNLVHFGAFEKHIGFYPTPSGMKQFTKELKPYKTAKGSAQFPLNQPIPYDLIEKIVKFRVKENQAKKVR